MQLELVTLSEAAGLIEIQLLLFDLTLHTPTQLSLQLKVVWEW